MWLFGHSGEEERVARREDAARRGGEGWLEVVDKQLCLGVGVCCRRRMLAINCAYVCRLDEADDVRAWSDVNGFVYAEAS